LNKKDRIRELIPAIGKIRNPKLRSSVTEVWVKAWEESAWEDVAGCPFSLESQDCSLIQHTNFVIGAALAMASSAEEMWKSKVDIDLLTAGAILHDVSKMVEFAPEEGKLGKVSATGENLVHATYGVHLALNAGLPLGVINLIGTHSPQVSKLPKGVEGIVLCYADYAAADIFNLRRGKPLLLGTVELKLRP